MKNILATLFLAFWFSIGSAAGLQTFSARVVGVLDGDTIDVLSADRTQTRIRLAGIDAPEKAQPFSQRSKQLLSDLVFGKTVEIEWSKRERYGRVVGRVLLDGRDMNLEMVKAGLAWHYKTYEREQRPEDRTLYATSETAARKKRIGLWTDLNPTAPWDYRHNK